MLLALSLIASCTTVLSMQLLARRKRIGWIVSLCNQMVWWGIIVSAGAWGLSILQVALFITALQGWRKWRT